MYICMCKGITDNDIQLAVENGAKGFRQIQKDLGVSTDCGQCTKLAKKVFRESVNQHMAMSNLYYAAN